MDATGAKKYEPRVKWPRSENVTLAKSLVMLPARGGLSLADCDLTGRRSLKAMIQRKTHGFI